MKNTVLKVLDDLMGLALGLLLIALGVVLTVFIMGLGYSVITWAITAVLGVIL